MDFESPDVEKDFPGLYASETSKKSHSNSDYSDDEKSGRKDILGKKKDKKESKKDKGYMAFEGESSDNETSKPRSPSRGRKNKTGFKFPGKDKKEKQVKEKETKDKRDDDDDSKSSKKEFRDSKKENKKSKQKSKEDKSKKESKQTKDKEKKKNAVEQNLEEKQIFGIPLHKAVERNKGHDNISVPVIVRECIDYIEEHGITCEGIYGMSGMKSKVQRLKLQYNAGEKIHFWEYEPHVIANLLKQFLKELPEPLLTTELLPKFEETATMKNQEKQITTLKNLLDCLPTCNYLLLSWIVLHMVHVAKLESKNKMNMQNLSIVFGRAMKISHQLLHVLFTHSCLLFKGIEIKKYVPSVCPDTDYLLLETGSSSAIEEELRQHENLLNVIHSELNAGLRDPEKEEQLWEIQRIVTQLKRKLRFLCQTEEASKSANTNPDEAMPEEKVVVLSGPTVATISENKSNDNSQKITDLPTQTILGPQNLEPVVSEAHPEANQTTLTVEVPLEETVPENNGYTRNINNDEVEEVDSESKQCEIDMQDASADLEKETENQNVLPSEDTSPIHSKLDAALTDEMCVLNNEGFMLIIEEEELSFLADELKRKIIGERAEIKRLKASIAECLHLHKYQQLSQDSQEASTDSNDSSASELDETDVLDDIVKKNKVLKLKNIELSKDIQRVRETCIDLKVQIKVALKMRNV